MLGFERRVVAALTDAADPRVRAGVEAWVETSLRDMPDHLRLGVWVESVLLGVWARVAARDDDAALLRSLQASPLWPVRQYVRLLRSLVLFAEHELEPAG